MEEVRASVPVPPRPALIEGALLKKSEWLGSFNQRHVALEPQEASTPAVLTWKGGKQPGSFPLTKCIVSLEGKDMIIRAEGGREACFRGARGGLPLENWYQAIAVLGADASSEGGAVQLDLGGGGGEEARFMSVAIP